MSNTITFVVMLTSWVSTPVLPCVSEHQSHLSDGPIWNQIDKWEMPSPVKGVDFHLETLILVSTIDGRVSALQVDRKKEPTEVVRISDGAKLLHASDDQRLILSRMNYTHVWSFGAQEMEHDLKGDLLGLLFDRRMLVLDKSTYGPPQYILFDLDEAAEVAIVGKRSDAPREAEFAGVYNKIDRTITLFDQRDASDIDSLKLGSDYVQYTDLSHDGKLAARIWTHSVQVFDTGTEEMIREIPARGISSIAFSGREQRLAHAEQVGSTTKTVIRDPVTGEVLARLGELPGHPMAIAWSKDCNSIAVGTYGDKVGHVGVWSVKD